MLAWRGRAAEAAEARAQAAAAAQVASQAERQEAVIGCFVRYFGQAAARPEWYVERDWMAEEFTRGCYGAHFAPGVWTSYGEAWCAPIGSSTGPAPSAPPSGTATWKAQSAAAKPLRRQSPPHSYSPRHAGGR